jgi:hypothetical protein
VKHTFVPSLNKAMKRILFTLVGLLALVAAKAAEGDRPSKDSNQKVTKMHAPDMEAYVKYDGGDTLYLMVETTDDEPVNIRLMGGRTTLLNDHSHHKQLVKRAYVITAFPVGEYKIRLKKGNYVVEKTFVKKTEASRLE